MIVLDCAQKSQEWFDNRIGVITASMFDLCTKRKDNGELYKEAYKYAFQIAMERITGRDMKEGKYQTWEMDYGDRMEDEARLAHEDVIETFIDQIGLVLTDDRRFGASPDGLFDPSGGSEYKCLTSPEKVMDILLSQDISDYKPQIQGGLWLTGRKVWDFGLYCPSLSDVDKQLVLHRCTRDEEYIFEMEQKLLDFDALVEDYRRRILEAPTRFGFDEALEDAEPAPAAAPEATSGQAIGLFQQ